MNQNEAKVITFMLNETSGRKSGEQPVFKLPTPPRLYPRPEPSPLPGGIRPEPIEFTCRPPFQQPTGGKAVHRGVRCDGCGMLPIIGPRYKCKDCQDFDLCHQCCVDQNLHPQHQFLLVRSTIQ